MIMGLNHNSVPGKFPDCPLTATMICVKDSYVRNSEKLVIECKIKLEKTARQQRKLTSFSAGASIYPIYA